MSELPPRTRDPGGEGLDPEDLELAALYALGAMGEDERRTVERQRSGDETFWAEVRSQGRAVERLAEDSHATSPRRDLWPEILTRIQAATAEGVTPEGRSPVWKRQVWKHWDGEARTETLLRGAGTFEPTDVPGITVRRLFVDVAADRVTMLVRMAPGTAYPAHRHGGAEECYVLEGDLEIGTEVEMGAGDYQRMDAGSLHPIQSTRAGCLLLISGSRHDELVA